MPRCIDQRTELERGEVGWAYPPILVSRVVLEERSKINIYTLRTAPTTEHERDWLHPNEPSLKVPLHYATSLSAENQRGRTMLHEYYSLQDLELKDKNIADAMVHHLDLVNYLRDYGGFKTKQLMHDPTRE